MWHGDYQTGQPYYRAGSGAAYLVSSTVSNVPSAGMTMFSGTWQTITSTQQATSSPMMRFARSVARRLLGVCIQLLTRLMDKL